MRRHSDITSILCFTTASFLTCVILCRVPSSAQGASASTSPPSAPSMSCRSAADWATAAESPFSGATGASLCCGDPTTAQLWQVKYLLQLMETMKGVKMRKILPFRSPPGQHVSVVVDPAVVLLRSTDPHPVGRYVAAPWKVGYSWWLKQANLPTGHRKGCNILACCWNCCTWEPEGKKVCISPTGSDSSSCQWFPNRPSPPMTSRWVK